MANLCKFCSIEDNTELFKCHITPPSTPPITFNSFAHKFDNANDSEFVNKIDNLYRLINKTTHKMNEIESRLEELEVNLGIRTNTDTSDENSSYNVNNILSTNPIEIEHKPHYSVNELLSKSKYAYNDVYEKFYSQY